MQWQDFLGLLLALLLGKRLFPENAVLQTLRGAALSACLSRLGTWNRICQTGSQYLRSYSSFLLIILLNLITRRLHKCTGPPIKGSQHLQAFQKRPAPCAGERSNLINLCYKGERRQLKGLGTVRRQKMEEALYAVTPKSLPSSQNQPLTYVTWGVFA